MTRTIALKNVPAILLVACFAALTAPVPASAGGGISLTLTPKGKEAKALRKSLKLYSAARGFANSARVDQLGTGNGAAVRQSGKGNVAGVFQLGSNHNATVSQNGNNNGIGVLQFGKNSSTNQVQNGNGKLRFVIQGNW